MVEITNNKLLNHGNAATRKVAGIWNSTRTMEGEGFLVNRSFPNRTRSDIDPFMLLDEMGPMDLAPGEAKGAPDHPHRGFETVTYLLDGKFQHKDSHGNSGKLEAGDVQWMTAGAGVIHSEMPEAGFARSGGRLHGFQLWVNLPRRDKMAKPHYQDIKSVNIPTGQSPDGKVKVKVIAGESLGRRAIMDTRTPIMYLHFTLQPGSKVSQPVAKNHNAFAYVIGGEGLFGSDERRATKQQVVLFGNDDDEVAIRAPDTTPLDVLFIAGAPLNEPVARYGPFVMNSEDEIQQAIDDYRSGQMGRIDF